MSLPTHSVTQESYRRNPADFKPGDLALVQWRRCKQRKPCYCHDGHWIVVGDLFAVVAHQAVCRRCYNVALGVRS